MASTSGHGRAKRDYPPEILDVLQAFESSLQDVDEILKPLLETSLSDVQEKITDPLERAKLDLVSAYSMNAMFWIYLIIQGVNPKEHKIKQELDRIRSYMNRVKEITDKKKALKVDRVAASRFIKHSLGKGKRKESPDGNPEKSKRKRKTGARKQEK